MLSADQDTGDLLEDGVGGVAHLALDHDHAETTDLSPGDQVGDFEVIAELGRGGMGVVYAARDRTLGRVAALKLLPARATDPEASERLIAEAQAASALDHPNVATIYQIGETSDGRRFIAMARYEGDTLRERLSHGPIKPREAFDIARQVASGLAAAHAAGLVHRDVKPENIFLTRHGLVKLLDFGIATLAGSPRDGPTTRGTVLYMSPEHARRQAPDARSDVWSLGVVLYEMLAGAPPFTGATAPEILAGIADPAPVKFPAPIRKIPAAALAVLSRALQKDPQKRYGDASAFATELERVSRLWAHPRRIRIGLAAAAVVVLATFWAFEYSSLSRSNTQQIPELAVLPVVGQAADTEAKELASALGDEIAARIVGLRRVRLVRTQQDSAGRIQGHPGLHLLRLAIRRNANGRTVAVSLEQSKTNRTLWSIRRTFDRKELRELGRDVVVGVLQAMGSPASERERAAIGNGFPSSAEAYEEFLQANQLLAVRTPASVESAMVKYRRAAQLDSMFASAFARQSYAYSILVDWGWKPTKSFPADPLTEGLALVDRATRLDSTSADAWLARAYLLVQSEPRRMTGSVEAFQRAITLDPYNAEAYHQYGQTLTALGRYTEALAAYRRVLDIEPDRAMTLVPVGAIYQRQGNLAEGIRMLDSAISAKPRVPYALATRSMFRSQAGDLKGALADAEFALTLDTIYRIPALSALAKVLWISGDTGAALATIRDAERSVANRRAPSQTEAFWIATAEVAMNRKREAIELLRNARPQAAWLWFYFQASDLAEFRRDPEVAALLANIDPRIPPR
jgi:tetratricopeptide (TPR) repeat protein